MIRPTVLIGLLLSSTSAGRRQYQTGCVSRGQQVSEKNSSRKLADQARLPTPRYRIPIRVYGYGFPRRTFLSSSRIEAKPSLDQAQGLSKRFLYSSIGLAHKFTCVSKKWYSVQKQATISRVQHRLLGQSHIDS